MVGGGGGGFRGIFVFARGSEAYFRYIYNVNILNLKNLRNSLRVYFIFFQANTQVL